MQLAPSRTAQHVLRLASIFLLLDPATQPSPQEPSQ